MANSKEVFDELLKRIRLAESKDEIQSMVYLILEDQLGITKTDVLRKRELGNTNLDALEDAVLRINRNEPVQYVLGEAGFYGRKFKVDPSVLIPRPETELIIDELLRGYSLKRKAPKGKQVLSAEEGERLTILEIGTGSGCIAITLAKEIPGTKIYVTDVSAAALMTAAENAKLHTATIEFMLHDILRDELLLKGIDFVVSNPPYVTLDEKSEMKKNVTDFEPPEALFVPDDDPLIFYSAIARAGKKVLKPGGKVVVEINERFGKEVEELFSNDGYHPVSIVKDFAGKDRVVTATMP